MSDRARRTEKTESAKKVIREYEDEITDLPAPFIKILERNGWRHESDLDPNERENERIWNPFGELR